MSVSTINRNVAASITQRVQSNTASQLSIKSNKNSAARTQGNSEVVKISQEAESASKRNNSLKALNDTVTLAQTTTDAVSKTQESLLKLREAAILSSQSSSNADRGELASKASNATKEINQIASETEFNGNKFLDGSFNQDVQTTMDSNQTRSIGDMSAKGLGIDNIDLSTKEGAQEALQKIDAALETTTRVRADMGTMSNRATNGIASEETSIERLSAAASRVRDVDSGEGATTVRTQILQNAGAAVMAQANANSQQVLSLLR